MGRRRAQAARHRRAGRLRDRAQDRRARDQSLVYENGVLARGATRGDGIQGRGRDREPAHDRRPCRCACSATALPPALLEVRGEVYFPLSGFRALQRAPQRDRQEAGAEPAQRCRGVAAADELRDHRRPAALGLGVRRRRARGPRARHRSTEMLTWLREHGFRTNPHAERLETIDEVAAACEHGRAGGPSSTTRSTAS